MTRITATSKLIRLTWISFGLAFAAVAAIVVTILNLRSDALNDAIREQRNLAVILGQQISYATRSIETALGDVEALVAEKQPRNAAELRTMMQTEQVRRFLLDKLTALSKAEVVSIIGGDGSLVVSTFSWPTPNMNLADRQHFIGHRDSPSKSLQISNPLVSRTSGATTIYFTRRLSAADGSFLGIALVGMNIQYFHSTYSSISALKDKSMLLLRPDGTVLVRYPDVNNRAGERIPAGSPWHAILSRGGGHYRSPGYFDKEGARVVVVQPLDDYPLVINVAATERAVLALWRMRATQIGLGALLAFLCAGYLLNATYGQFRKLLSSEKSLLDKGEAMALQNLHFSAALENMPHGLCMYDSSQRLIIANSNYRRMYRLGAELVKPGVPLQAVLEARVASGTAPKASGDFVENALARTPQDADRSMESELEDGRIASVIREPMPDGGWVSIHMDVTEKRLAERKIAYLAHHDALTGLPNRVQLREHIELSLGRMRRGSESIAVLCLDLDHFKNVNDSLGHPVGDALLHAVSERLRGCLRDTDMVARTGGDEFSIVQAGAEQPTAASALAERIVEALSAPFDLGEHQVVIGTSVGIAMAPVDGTEPDQLLKNADLAMYRAKTSGRGTYSFFAPEMDAKAQARRLLEQDLRKAIIAQEFEIFYQPIVNLEDDRIVGFEALLRWNHPTRGRIPPIEFIPLAEETGLIIPIGEWVIRNACAEANTWAPGLRVAVNISPVQFRSRSLVSTVVTSLGSSGLSPMRLELEITEAILLHDNEATLAVLHQLRDLGVKISMDDFGTGYSSLSYLRSFPFDKIKIDQSFIRDLADNPDSIAIIRAVTGLGKSFGMLTTAEGVETREQLEQMRAEGCTEVQGYFYGRPTAANEIAGVLAGFQRHVKAS